MRFGLIGTGLAGPLFGGAFQAHPAGAELVAVAARRAESAKAGAERWGARWSTDDWRKLIESDEIDAVCIATPTGSHAEIAVAAANAGKHVLTEKPMATTLDDADRMIAAAARNKVTLGVIFMYRFMDSARLLREAVTDGHLGRPLLAECFGRFWRDQAYYDSGPWRGTWAGEGGGALMTQTSHTLDLLLWVLGDVEEVSAYWTVTPLHEIETEDLVVAILRFRNGAVATLTSSSAVKAPGPRSIAISGERGLIELVGDDIGRWTIPALEERARGFQSSGADRGDTALKAGFTDSELHRRQIEDFVTATREGRRPAIDGLEGRKTLEVIRAVYRSAATRQPVRLPVGADPTANPGGPA